MAVTSPDFTIGIEEEYLLVDRDSLDLAEAPMRAPVLFVIGHVVSLYRAVPLTAAAPGIEAAVMAGE